MHSSIMFTIILYSSLVQFPSMEKNKEAWAIYVERTFFGFILFAVGEILSDVYLVCNLKREAEFDYQVRFIGFVRSLSRMAGHTVFRTAAAA